MNIVFIINISIQFNAFKIKDFKTAGQALKPLIEIDPTVARSR
jgi:hypothetical protein